MIETTEAPIESCGSCRYFKRNAELNWGSCVRHPPPSEYDPGVGYAPTGTYVATQVYKRFPIVTDDTYCGEYRTGQSLTPYPILADKIQAKIDQIPKIDEIPKE